MIAKQDGTTNNNAGDPGMFTTVSGVASSLYNTSTAGYVDARIFGTDYWAPTTTNISMFGAKLSHAISATTFYEATVQRFAQGTDTNPGSLRDTERKYLFGNSYYVDEAPFGFQPYPSTGIVGLRMGVGMSNSRDTSRVETWSARFDLTTQIDKYNQVKAGLEFAYTDNWVRARNIDVSATERPLQHELAQLPDPWCDVSAGQARVRRDDREPRPAVRVSESER